jgi:hypothetical protein
VICRRGRWDQSPEESISRPEKVLMWVSLTLVVIYCLVIRSLYDIQASRLFVVTVVISAACAVFGGDILVGVSRERGASGTSVLLKSHALGLLFGLILASVTLFLLALAGPIYVPS